MRAQGIGLINLIPFDRVNVEPESRNKQSYYTNFCDANV